MSSSRAADPRNRLTVLACLVAVGLSPTHAQPSGNVPPVLRHERPVGFDSSTAEGVEAWVSASLDGVVHFYAFQPFHGDFQQEFRRALFRDRIAAPYREDRLLAAPAFKTLAVVGAESSLSVSFKNYNGGAPREHFRVAILAAGCVALVDVSANSPEAFQKNWSSVSSVLRSLRVVTRDLSVGGPPMM
jgi:hypothetical protein